MRPDIPEAAEYNSSLKYNSGEKLILKKIVQKERPTGKHSEIQLEL